MGVGLCIGCLDRPTALIDNLIRPVSLEEAVSACGERPAVKAGN